MRALGVVVMGLLLGCGGQLNVGPDGSTSGTGGESSMNASGGSFAAGGMAAAMGGRPVDTGLGGSVNVAGGRVGMNTFGGQASPAYGGQVGMNTFGGQASPAYGGRVGMNAFGGQASPAGGSPVGGMPAMFPEWPTNADAMKLPGITGVWEGYTEDFLFRPVDKFRVEIAGLTEDGIVRGSVYFGDGMLAPADDPDAAYPSDAANGSRWSSSFIDGATYTIIDGAQRGQAVRFEVATSEAMRSWCELQTPYATDAGYSCVPTGCYPVGRDCSVELADGEIRTFSATKCDQCAECVCNAMMCTAGQYFIQLFDLTLDMAGDALSGTVGGTPIELERVQ